MPNIAQIAQIHNNPFLAGLVKSVAEELKLFTNFDVSTSDKDKVISLSEGESPSMSFLNFGEGYETAEALLEMGEFQLSRIGGAVEEIRHKVQKWDKEKASLIGAGLEYDWMSLQMMKRVRGGLISLERQMIYGRANDPKGFPGLKELTPGHITSNVISFANGLLGINPEDYDYGRTTLNVGGTTAATASSVYSVCYGPTNCQLVIHGGQEGGFLEMSPIRLEYTKSTDPVDGKVKSDYHYVATASGWAGLIVSGSNEDHDKRRFKQFSVRRAFNITADNGKGCTPDVLDALWQMHPDGHKPNVFIMSPRSYRQYLAAIGAKQTIFVGADSGPQGANYNYGSPQAIRHNGVPIIVTDRVKSNDAIEVPA